jgi:serine/threonine protein phosphatase 1
LVHAGLNFKLANPFEDFKAMRWAKNYTVDFAKTGNRRLIHGHVPHTLTEIERNFANAPAICLDNGCVYTGKADMGNLVALEINSFRLEVQENIDVLLAV